MDSEPGDGGERAREPWTEPVLGELELSRTAMNPGIGADGGEFDVGNHS